MPTHKPKTEKQTEAEDAPYAVKTVHCYFLDEGAVSAILPLKRVGTWEGTLPPFEVLDSRLDGSCSNCAVVRAIGSTAGYAVLEGLLVTKHFEDGDLIVGSEYLPVAAFHARMYEAVIPRLAEVLSRYDRVIARCHDPKKNGRPIGSIGNFGVQFQDGMKWCCPGSIEPTYSEWQIGKPETPIAEAAVVDSTAPGDAKGTPAHEDAADATDSLVEAVEEALDGVAEEPVPLAGRFADVEGSMTDDLLQERALDNEREERKYQRMFPDSGAEPAFA